MRKLIYLLTVLFVIAAKNADAQFVEAQQCIGGSGNDIIVDVQKTADSGLIVLVNTTSSDGDFADNTGTTSNALIKLNRHYEIEWKKSFGDSGVIAVSGLQEFNQGYFLQYFSNTYDSIDSFTVQYNTYFNLLCLDANGNKRWQKKYLSDGTTSGTLFYYYLAIPQYQLIKLLRNNTIAFPTLSDSTISIHNLDMNGNTLWELSYNYDTLFRNSNYGGWGMNFNLYDNIITELSDSTLLLINSLQDYCFWFCTPTVHKTHFINIDYNGTLIKENYADTALSYLSKKVKEDTDFIYFNYLGGYSVQKINKNNLTLEQNNYYYGNIINSSNNIIISTGTDIQDRMPLYLISLFDSVNNYNKYILQKVDLLNNSIVYQTLLDTTEQVYSTLGNISAYSLPHNEFVIIYSKYYEYRIVKIDQAGNIVYNKLLSPSVRMNESISGYLPYQNIFYYYQFRNYNIGYNNKFYSYNTWSYYDTSTLNTIYTQKFFIHNLENGELEYEFNNNMQDSLVYKFIAPYPDKKNELFVLADLNGQNTCRLGGFDIIMAKTITATNKILGKAFIDYNSNQLKETGEPQYTLAYLESNKGNYSLSTYMNGNNYAVNYADTGTWTTKLIPHHNYYDINPVAFVSSHTTFGNSDTVLFAMHPKRTVNDLKVSLVNPFITRPGRDNNYEIAYANEGTHTANGTVKLILDSRLNFVSSLPNSSTQSGDTLIWDFTNLLVNETRKIIVSYTASIPPQLDLNDSLHSVVFIEPAVNDSTPGDNMAVLDEIVRGSYDPNDKTATSGSTITPEQIQRGDYITYVVRFQNTGNDTAFRIVIEDTLDANLDWSTLQPLNTSHPFSMQVVNKNIIQFTFSNMKLPPASINEPESHGFIAYKVKPKADLAQGSTIKNTAHIYFDFNAPVTTNTVNTQVALLSSIKNNYKGEGKISVYPNPNNGIFNLEFTANYTSPLLLTIIDITGKVVYQSQINHQHISIVTINTENLSGGLYSVVIKTDKEEQTQKLIIDK